MVPAAAPGLPVHGHPLESVPEPVYQPVDGLARGGGGRLHPDEAPVQIDVDLPGDRQMLGRIPVPDQPHPDVQRRLPVMPRQQTLDLLARVVRETLGEFTFELDDDEGCVASALCVAHLSS
jgi:hypothetical protein